MISIVNNLRLVASNLKLTQFHCDDKKKHVKLPQSNTIFSPVKLPYINTVTRVSTMHCTDLIRFLKLTRK